MNLLKGSIWYLIVNVPNVKGTFLLSESTFSLKSKRREEQSIIYKMLPKNVEFYKEKISYSNT